MRLFYASKRRTKQTHNAFSKINTANTELLKQWNSELKTGFHVHDTGPEFLLSTHKKVNTTKLRIQTGKILS